MAHIIYRRARAARGAVELIINGLDLSMETYTGPGLVELVEVGEGDSAEVGFRITLAVGRLDLDCEADVKVTDRLPSVAQQVRSMSEDVPE